MVTSQLDVLILDTKGTWPTAVVIVSVIFEKKETVFTCILLNGVDYCNRSRSHLINYTSNSCHRVLKSTLFCKITNRYLTNVVLTLSFPRCMFLWDRSLPKRTLQVPYEPLELCFFQIKLVWINFFQTCFYTYFCFLFFSRIFQSSGIPFSSNFILFNRAVLS